MSVGNLKTQGQKGTNWTWQYRMLLGLDKIAASIATNGLEYEAELVSITCPGPVPPVGPVIRLEVRVWDATTGGFDNIKYYRPGDINPDSADYSACTKEYLEEGDASEATLELCRLLLVAIDADTSNIATNSGDTATNTGAIDSNTTPVTGVTPALLRPTTSGTVAAGARSVSIANVGAASGTVLGIELAAGETVNFDAGSLNNTLGAVTYDPTTPGATTFLIATLT